MNTKSSFAALDRRQWLRRSGAMLAGAFGAGSVGTLANLALGARPAYAGDYKALVCISLNGGNDGFNTFVPTDSSRYNQYSAVRGALAIPKSRLLSLPGSNYGLHPSLSALMPYWNQAKLAGVFNVGPLHAPLSKAEYLAEPEGSPLVPGNLFSHSDQQLLWQCGGSDTTVRTGWGGRAATTLSTYNPVISVGGNGIFGVEELRTPLVLPGPGQLFGATGLMPADLGWQARALRRTALDQLYAAKQNVDLADTFTVVHRDAFAVSERIGTIVSSAPGDGSSTSIDNAFAPLIKNGQLTTELGAQLYQIAKLIRSNLTVGGSRQIFLADLGGFDTHSEQVDAADPTIGMHADLLQQLGDALAAFQRALVAIGMEDQVTTFTQADFGRTFAPNSTYGTDHAWGNNQLVIGGAVKGKKNYGIYPELVLGGKDDVGVADWERQGRWIPTSSVDQYAATLLSWFGAGSGQVDQILPNLSNFGGKRNLGFV